MAEIKIKPFLDFKKSFIVNLIIRACYGIKDLPQFINSLEEKAYFREESVKELKSKLEHQKEHYEKELKMERDASLSQLEEAIEENDRQARLIKRLEKQDLHNHHLDSLFRNFSDGELYSFLEMLKTPHSKKLPQNKICNCNWEHKTTQGYDILLKRLSRNRYIEKIMSEQIANKKSKGIQINYIFDDCIKLAYCRNNLAVMLHVITTSKKELNNLIIAELIKRY